MLVLPKLDDIADQEIKTIALKSLFLLNLITKEDYKV